MEYIKKVMASKEGREFMNELLAVCGIHRSADSLETNALVLREGKRQIGLYLMDVIQSNADRKDLYKMQEEAYLLSKERENEYEKLNRTKERNHNNGTDFDFSRYAGIESEEYGTHESDDSLGL